MLINVCLSFISAAGICYVAHGQDMPYPTPGTDTTLQQVSLLDLLDSLEQAQGVSFAYQKQLLTGLQVTHWRDTLPTFDTALANLLKPLALQVKKVRNGNRFIYVIRPNREPPPPPGEPPVVFAVQGVVTCEPRGEVLAGVNVIVAGTGIGTVTDEHGYYAIAIPNPQATLSFSYIGYATLEVPVDRRRVVDAMLAESSEALEEVLITALGIGRDQRALGYAVSTVTEDEITDAGNTNIVSSMYGRAPGVRVRTAPGGATSAVTMQIRGFNSLNYNTQPLYVIDGVIVRDGNEHGVNGVNNDDYWTQARIQGNGILDINPMDIAQITVLKGASATALYGSDASSGVVIMTTKKGSGTNGLGIDVNYTFMREEVAFTPKFQNTYGPGFDREQNVALGATDNGWVSVDADADGTVDGVRPLFESYAQFGPAMKGQQVYWWDGQQRTYKAHPNNYKNFYRDGYLSSFNMALGNTNEQHTYRFSYTHNDYQGIQVGGKQERNTFDFNSGFSVNDRLHTDVVIHYYNSKVHNRPVKINRLRDSWSGFFSRAEDMSLMFDRYQTSSGYKWVPYDQSAYDPEEALQFVTPMGYEVMDFLWTQLRNQEDESQHRLISSLTLRYDLPFGLEFRGRLGDDFTASDKEIRAYNEYPVVYNINSSTGEYANATGRYDVFYADVLLRYAKHLSPNLKLSGSGGFQWKDERYKDQTLGTSGGLAIANWFSLNNSYNANKVATLTRSSILKYAYLGFVDLQYKKWLYLEGTARKEYSSTLAPGHNSYFYPSVNAAFIFSDVIMGPAWLNYAKLRASYGIVGNAPPVYESNSLYTTTTLQTVNGSVVSALPQGALSGNTDIRPERNYEMEFGLETSLVQHALSVDLTYYNNRVNNQILQLDLPTSTGAEKRLTNIGELRSQGWELGIWALPVAGAVRWEASLNMAYNTTRVYRLRSGSDRLVFSDLESSSIQIVAAEGQRIGNIYVYPLQTDDDGNRIVDSDGLYTVDKTRYTRAGNVLPVSTGGFSSTLTYRAFSLNFLLDYSLGGQIVSTSLKYAKGAGLYANTMKYRDARHGGLPYYEDASGNKIPLPNHASTAPDDASVYHDGIVLKGVTETGEANTTVVDAASYYINMFDWGNDAWNSRGAVYDNSYIKLREVVLAYTLPARVLERLPFRKLQVSLMGRNLFYVWKTLENLDPEATLGTNWVKQGIDQGSNDATRSYGFAINISL